ncbi:hypothetical protein H257_01270 [Aphanomyces astaci]|uniref:Uncharacterized protein n=1 Tax=Aphanomyces astaci TaxID=112090 RepID=W4H8D9_APHAT|nr:hypothetical protein H257_01270 [Aphanomyces astaci]ETV87831.1 hypothetical protein H257_01270 [Aphanomyces astaci]|eukprot:XP_009822694.1 hypothetical protein H257_01270 [Aphanomyces astaci]
MTSFLFTQHSSFGIVDGCNIEKVAANKWTLQLWMSGADESPLREESDPWLGSPDPACVDSLVACSSITPDVRATISVWSRGAPWLNPLTEEASSVPVDSSASLGSRKARRNVWVCAVIVLLGMLGAAILLAYVAFVPSQKHFSPPPSPTRTIAPEPAIPPSPTTNLAPGTTTAVPAYLLYEPGALVLVNECTTESTVYFTRTMPNAVAEVGQREMNSTQYVMVVPGKHWDDFIAADFRLGESIFATNFAVNRDYGQVFYSISTRNGFNVPVEVAPMREGATRDGCPVLRCDAHDCEGRVHVQFDCNWIERLQVTFCPSSSLFIS